VNDTTPCGPADATHRHFDALETRDPAERERALMAALPATVRAFQGTPAGAALLAGVDADGVTTRTALAALPVLRKHALMARQHEAHATAGDPLGGFAAAGWRALGRARAARRVYQSPGPIYEVEGLGCNPWNAARAFWAAGFRAGDLVHNSFSYHLTPGAWIMESGAQAIGCTTFPGGVGNTEMQLQAAMHLQPDAYTGTPSFLRILVEKAAESGVSLGRLKKALVSGEAFPPSLRDWLLERGIAGYQAYATADCGVIAYETEARQGLVVEEGVLVEIVRPGTGDPLPEGEVGEVVVTVLSADTPLLRFGTGDLSAVLPGPCPSGRTNTRLRGWLGRADQTTKMRGMFVHAEQVAAVMKRHPELLRARLVVSGAMANDEVTLHAEVRSDGATPQAEGLAAALQSSVRELTKLRAEIVLVAPGTLPNDGKLIEDRRSHA
jgi:phenylacetate-CoA ligase